MMIIDTIKRICELQPKYSHENTPEMIERGILVRHTLRNEMSALSPMISKLLGRFADDLEFGASDGKGNKVQAPWVRFYSRRMSPNPQSGFYAVTHFSADGRRVFLTLGCGSTRRTPSGFVPIAGKDILPKKEWARRTIVSNFGSLKPFEDDIDLKSTMPLPLSFERATVIASAHDVSSIDYHKIESHLMMLAERLRSIYEAQSVGSDCSGEEIATFEAEAISRPQTKSGQGFGLRPEDRLAVELRAMEEAEKWLRSLGYTVKNTSKNNPFDFLATKDADLIKVEVKGTTVEVCNAIFMTSNEIELHRTEKGRTALIVVSDIRLQEIAGRRVATGGKLHSFMGWDIDSFIQKPLAYQVHLK